MRFIRANKLAAPHTMRLLFDLTTRRNSGKIRLDERWITVNGTPVQVGEGGELQGEVGAKIMNETNEIAQTENAGDNSTPAETSDTMEESGGGLSATGANPDIPDMNKRAQLRHEKHLQEGKSYPGMTMEEYVQKSSELVRSAVDGDILGFQAKDGGIVRYNQSTGDFAKGYSTGVATMFVPKNGIAYFENEREK